MKLLSFIALAMLSATPAIAEKTRLLCQFSGGYAPEQLLLELDSIAQTARWLSPDYVDPRGKRVVGPISRNDVRRVEVSFEPVGIVNSSGQYTNMHFIFTYIRPNNVATMHAIPSGYDNRFSSHGACAPH